MRATHHLDVAGALNVEPELRALPVETARAVSVCARAAGVPARRVRRGDKFWCWGWRGCWDRSEGLGRAARTCGTALGASATLVGLQEAAATGPQVAAGVAGRLCNRATGGVGKESAVLQRLAQRAALRGILCQPQAMGVHRIGWEHVAGSEFVVPAGRLRLHVAAASRSWRPSSRGRGWSCPEQQRQDGELHRVACVHRARCAGGGGSPSLLTGSGRAPLRRALRRYAARRRRAELDCELLPSSRARPRPADCRLHCAWQTVLIGSVRPHMHFTVSLSEFCVSSW